MNVEGVDIIARGIAARGRAFEGVSLRAEPGDLVAVVGPSGSGRTSLLLALSGRMKLAAGQLDVSGLAHPEDAAIIRDLIIPARLRPGYELDPHHRVRDAVAERRVLSDLSQRDVLDAFDLVGVDPHPKALIHQLSPLDGLLLCVALAVAEQPPGILVDDVDHGLTTAHRTRAWAALRAVADTGTTVLASATDAPAVRERVVHLPADADQRADTAEDLLFLHHPGLRPRPVPIEAVREPDAEQLVVPSDTVIQGEIHEVPEQPAAEAPDTAPRPRSGDDNPVQDEGVR